MSNQPAPPTPELESPATSQDESAIPLDQRRFLTLDDVATILNVSKRTVSKLVETGELKSHRFRTSRRVSREHLNEYIKQAAADDRPTRGELHQQTVRRPRRDRKKTNA